MVSLVSKNVSFVRSHTTLQLRLRGMLMKPLKRFRYPSISRWIEESKRVVIRDLKRGFDRVCGYGRDNMGALGYADRGMIRVPCGMRRFS